ncbi:DNA-binding response regulator [Paenibacillus sp. 598K]|uniref:response regulator n=1 Tax=Paenibacillus sp. 598K TaxID=1117987 RepID=UPI000FF95A89|nr:response regulator [Paenibacillus sp. 598K]GBF75938.1 DNA-binding response regulator [Paenibacillus sp. 598K]
MNIILVDDEPLALKRLNKLLSEHRGCHVLGISSDPLEALDMIERLQPDLVFLDIEMPGINGIQAAEEIRQLSQRTEIIFTTAHRDYALVAYGLEVMDYIVKPVTRERLDQTMRMLERRLLITLETSTALPTIYCLGNLQIQAMPDLAPTPMNFRTAKIRELFAFLLHHRGTPVKRDLLLDMLWPELDEKRGIANLYTSIHRLRAMLTDQAGEGKVSIHYRQFGYELDMHALLVDTELWQERLQRLTVLTPASVHDYEQVMNAYTGYYLQEDDYNWAEVERNRLHALWRKLAETLADYYDVRDAHTEAIAIYHRLQQFEPGLESAALSLMKIYHRLHNAIAVEQQYQRLVKTLQQEAGVRPGHEVNRWYAEWKAGKG